MLFSTCLLQGQNEASNWFFGENCGLYFDGDSVLTNTSSEISPNEGVSTISDCKGNLLFYSDGQSVWDRRHSLMANGQGLDGHYSATQGSIIIPHPGNCDLFFIFTLDAKENNYREGLKYSVVDRSLQNGYGEVTLKNVPLYAPAAEKLTAVKHSNGVDVWVISHEMYSNSFRSYLVTSAGLNPDPVISSAGTVFNQTHDGMGQMKVSANGSKLAFVTLVTKFVEIFDFDNSSGLVSNPIHIPSDHFTALGGLYGLEFSPDAGKLYVSNPHLHYLDQPGNLYQVDLLAGSPLDIINSTTIVGHNLPSTDIRGLQLAPDGKIYVSRAFGRNLGVINNPDAAGLASDYLDSGLDLNNKVALWTLPNFITSFLDIHNSSILGAEFQFENTCVGEPVQFREESTGDATSFLWDFGDGNFSTDQHPNHTYFSTGSYDVSLVVSKECCQDTFTKRIQITDCTFYLYAPNAFSPNGDGINDVYYLKGAGIEALTFEVFNRWGQMIYKSNDIHQGWDGQYKNRKLDPGVYLYKIMLRYTNGEQSLKTGSITLLR